jgi:hypothetical protein
LQEKKQGAEFAVGGWYGPGGWCGCWYENLENKKLMVGDLGPNTGEMGCYSEDTEVLTKDGWKYWHDVTSLDQLATLDEGRLCYERPSALVRYDIDSTMIGWKNQTIDILVTPNHQMYVQSQFGARTGRSGFVFRSADKCTQAQYTVLRTAKWDGNDLATFTVPGYRHRKGFGYTLKPDLVFDAEAWARFVGLYIAEGSCGNSVNIAQSHPAKMYKAEQVIKSAGLSYRKVKRGFNIYRRQLARHLKPLGRAWEKRVPQWIKDSSPRIINAFLEGYAIGDGHLNRAGWRSFYTVSKVLADDLQELLLKIGRLGTVKMRSARTTPSYIDGRLISSSRPQYEVYERTQQFKGWLDKRDRYETHYKGAVYCATVSSHLLFVRRNGKPLWCGNTVSMYVKNSKLADLALKPIAKHLKAIDYVGFIDISGMIDGDGEFWPFEFTTRPGWPTFHNQMATHYGDPAQWMVDLLHGKDSLKVKMDVCCVTVVLAIPDFPYSHLTAKEVTGIPVYNCGSDQVHLCEVMIDDNVPVQINGNVVRMPHYVTCGDYVAVVAGCGETITGARRSAYAAVNKVKIPANPFYRTDIGRGRLINDLPLLQKHGFATGFKVI